MRLAPRIAAALAVLLSTAFVQAGARDLSPSPDRFGATKPSDQYEVVLGVLDYDMGLFTPHDYNGAVINGEVLFPSPDFLSAIGSPRPQIGFDAAIASNPVHFFYGGLSWEFRLAERIYVSANLGGAVTTAKNLKDPVGYNALGSRVLFHLGLGLGFDLTPHTTLQLYADHFSNADLVKPNDGQEAAGVRLGYRF